MTKTFGALALLVGSLAGCGGGAGAASGGPDTAVAGLEEDASASNASATPKSAAPAARVLDSTLIPPPGSSLEREDYAYNGGGRDPFVSVLDNAGIGPELVDLDLTGIYFMQRDPSASVAVLRDRITNKTYTLKEGERLGRARVADIREKEVTFTVDDYGTARQVTMSLRKREDLTP